MPIARSAVLWGHVLTSLIANLTSLVLVVLVAVAIGFRSGAGVLAWLAVLGIIVLFTLALTWLAVGAGLARSEEHTSELQSIMRITYAVFCLKKKKSITILKT